jgi:hypothetical protein
MPTAHRKPARTLQTATSAFFRATRTCSRKLGGFLASSSSEIALSDHSARMRAARAAASETARAVPPADLLPSRITNI